MKQLEQHLITEHTLRSIAHTNPTVAALLAYGEINDIPMSETLLSCAIHLALQNNLMRHEKEQAALYGYNRIVIQSLTDEQVEFILGHHDGNN